MLTIENAQKLDELYYNIKDVLKEISHDCVKCKGKSYVMDGVPLACSECVTKYQADMFEKVIKKIV